jgi:tRNA 2-selenouridine synthase
MNTPLIEETEFKELLVSDTPFIDVRAEIEAAKASLPTSRNFPILNTKEREQVGICYKQNGQDAAVALGHEIVSGPIREQRILDWTSFLAEHPNSALFCWRGGKRSELAQQWLNESGNEIRRIKGGYKAIRTFLLNQVEQICSDLRFIVIAGRTGCGKTEFLHSIKRKLETIDLEGLAAHRGSAFGDVYGEQPPQATFDNHVIIDLLKSHSRDASVVAVESESRLVGRLAVPPALINKMQSSEVLVLECSFEERIERILHEYVINNPLIENLTKPEERASRLEEYLVTSLTKISKKLGGQRTKELIQITKLACKQQLENNDLSAHRKWIEIVLGKYYDPPYDKYLRSYSDRIVFTGGHGSSEEFLKQVGEKR